MKQHAAVQVHGLELTWKRRCERIHMKEGCCGLEFGLSSLRGQGFGMVSCVGSGIARSLGLQGS